MFYSPVACIINFDTIVDYDEIVKEFLRLYLRRAIYYAIFKIYDATILIAKL